MKNGWVLQKGFKLWPRSHLEQDLSWRELHLPKVRSKWSKDLCGKSHITWAVKAETLKPVGTFGIKTPKAALLTASLAQYEAFLWDVKQCPGGPSTAEVQLHYGLTDHEVFYGACPQLFVVCSSWSPVFTEPSQKFFENWSQSQAASLFIDELFLRGTKWNYLLWKTSPNVRVSAGLSIFLIPSDIYSDCHFATVQYITDAFL